MVEECDSTSIAVAFSLKYCFVFFECSVPPFLYLVGICIIYVFVLLSFFQTALTGMNKTEIRAERAVQNEKSQLRDVKLKILILGPALWMGTFRRSSDKPLSMLLVSA